MFDAPHSDIVAVHVDEGAVLGKHPVQYVRSHQNTVASPATESSSSSGEEAACLSRTGCVKGDSVAA